MEPIEHIHLYLHVDTNGLEVALTTRTSTDHQLGGTTEREHYEDVTDGMAAVFVALLKAVGSSANGWVIA